jgi:hypothetical protein
LAEREAVLRAGATLRIRRSRADRSFHVHEDDIGARDERAQWADKGVGIGAEPELFPEDVGSGICPTRLEIRAERDVASGAEPERCRELAQLGWGAAL